MRILYAEDDPLFQTMLKQLLGKWGYEVEIASDGNQALASLLGEKGPHLAILDWSMPGLEGVDVCKRIRASHQSYYIYIILLTSRDGADEFLAGMDAGADDYLTKPFDFCELRSRLHAAKRILDFEERVRILFEEAPVAYHEINREGVIKRVNRAECSLLGYSAQEMIGRPVWEFVAPQYRDESRSAVLRKMEDGGNQPVFERDYLRQDGTVLTMQIHENYIRDEHGCIEGIRSALLDISDRRRQEKELAKHAAELARSNEELEQFAYVASHDLQEPLRTISSYTQLLARRYKGKLGPDADDFIGFAVDGASRMQQLIRDLLKLSRVNTQAAAFKPVDANALLASSLLNLHSAIGDSKAEITQDPLPTVSVDAVQMGQLFQNLVGNAIKFSNGTTPRVHVTALDQGDTWRFSVSDNGIGIDAAYSERIFRVFQRLHTAKEYPGTGIGLAVCRKIVDRHGGRIWFDSKPGIGTTFHFTIPKSMPT